MQTTTTATLYQRLGGRPRIESIMNDVIARHLENPVLAPRFRNLGSERLEQARHLGTDFFCMGTGGPEPYTGRDMRTAHTGLNISEQEFVAALDDILASLDKHGVGTQERQEILATLYSLKGEIVRL